jgi:transcriptional regulator with XRE-family HTH domain
MEDLLSEIEEYEALRDGQVSVINIDSFDQLADGLIKARIAAGLSQKALAQKLGMKEQQVQRYESERYASASFQRLQDVAAAIGVKIREQILLPLVAVDFNGLLSKVRQVGIDTDFLLTRLLPSGDAAIADGTVAGTDERTLTVKTASILSRVFGWTQETLFGPAPLSQPTLAAAEARFKMPARRSQQSSTIYAAYANYLATVVLEGARNLPTHPIPIEAREFRTRVLAAYGELTLRSVLEFAWDLGVPVLPLKDRGTFHGACWRYEGRNVIVLKQNTPHVARWLFDVIHEMRHAGDRPDVQSLEIIEGDETSEERRNSNDEIEASQFAGDVVLDGRAEELAEISVKKARGAVERLKNAVPAVAAAHGVDTASLANYMAFRLSWQGINWWGAASNLQGTGEDPWSIARDVFLRRFPFAIESDIDRQLLQRALQEG